MTTANILMEGRDEALRREPGNLAKAAAALGAAASKRLAEMEAANALAAKDLREVRRSADLSRPFAEGPWTEDAEGNPVLALGVLRGETIELEGRAERWRIRGMWAAPLGVLVHIHPPLGRFATVFVNMPTLPFVGRAERMEAPGEKCRVRSEEPQKEGGGAVIAECCDAPAVAPETACCFPAYGVVVPMPSDPAYLGKWSLVRTFDTKEEAEEHAEYLRNLRRKGYFKGCEEPDRWLRAAVAPVEIVFAPPAGAGEEGGAR